jgi:serine kinase of HPr protein (carbohydrate metabolism regulator)
MTSVHGTTIQLGRAGEILGAPADTGILLLGESGAGKSDLALRLIERGSVLVADDRTELFVRNGTLMGKAPAGIEGLLELRGVGILELARAEEVRIDLAVLLAIGINTLRLPPTHYYDAPHSVGVPHDARPPLLHLAPFEASAPAKVVAAAAAHAKALFRDQRKSV